MVACMTATASAPLVPGGAKPASETNKQLPQLRELSDEAIKALLRPERTRRADWRESTLARRLCFAKSSAAHSWVTSASTSKRDPLKRARETSLSLPISLSACLLLLLPLCHPQLSLCVLPFGPAPSTYPHHLATNLPSINQQQPCNDPANHHPPNKKQKKEKIEKRTKKMEGEEEQTKKQNRRKSITRIFCVD
ncbi:MAG: hypothetical protein JOS17DRAFT_443685 [Linnemannia elongata]|nr:MAG: hypothetical protein JOS17DRAFT_443685 [Linnemannia elongata]